MHRSDDYRGFLGQAVFAEVRAVEEDWGSFLPRGRFEVVAEKRMSPGFHPLIDTTIFCQVDAHAQAQGRATLVGGSGAEPLNLRLRLARMTLSRWGRLAVRCDSIDSCG